LEKKRNGRKEWREGGREGKKQKHIQLKKMINETNVDYSLVFANFTKYSAHGGILGKDG